MEATVQSMWLGVGDHERVDGVHWLCVQVHSFTFAPFVIHTIAS